MKKWLSLIVSLALVLGVATGMSALAEGAAFEDSVDWAAEYDVIVVGFGAAGASTAITAADAGAKVLLLEKAPEGEAGGNSAICMQWICGTSDRDATITYVKALRGQYETPSDQIIETYVDGMTQNFEWFESLGAPNPQYFNYCEFPELPGADSFTPFTVNGNTGMSANAFGGDGAAYKLLKKNVFDRAENIDVWYEAPAVHLIQDGATGIIHGVQAQVDGQMVNVRAKGGVALCCGGFENSREMQQSYAQRVYWPATGNIRYNTGDGIRMALEVGADLWHMSNVVTNIEFYDEASQISTFAFQGVGRGILVAGDGRRFRAEDAKGRHGKYLLGTEYMNAYLPQTMYTIMDQAGLDAGRLHFTWSDDSQAEIEKGWITKADTIEQLAGKLSLDPAALTKTVETWNGFCAGGEDLAFGRTANLNPIAQGPFYAVKITPCIGNTQGGPVKNEKGEVLDPNGNPIPHLYEAGELGDIWSNCYQASNNFGGGCIFGRIIGKLAAQPKDDVKAGSVMDGKPNFAPASKDAQVAVENNQFVGQGQGKGGTPIVVRVTLEQGKLAAIEVMDQSETPVISQPAFDQIPPAMIAANSADVDVVSGATLTSNGLIEAVKDALRKAN